MKKLAPALGAELVALVGKRRGRARVRVTGDSMQPLLQAGMIVDVEPLRDPPRIGDVLVFKSRAGLIAHRLVGGESLTFRAHSGLAARTLLDERTGSFVTCGDAYPDHTEIVPQHLVVGRATAVWASADPEARRIDNRRYYSLGVVLARTQKLRSVFAKIRAYARILVLDPGPLAGPGCFSAIMAATRDFERRRYSAGVARLSRVPAQEVIAAARRHHAGGLMAHWLDAATAAGVAVPADLANAFARIRWTNALQAGRVLTCVRVVRDCFASAAIPHLFLKGGARLAADEPGADLQFAGDVDVLVPAGMADAALTALREAGFRDLVREDERVRFRGLHHREPLCPPHVDVPVEVHVALAPPALVSQRLDYAALAPWARMRAGPLGDVPVLDEVGAAVHLAYHARDLRVWRDIVLLSRLLRLFDEAARARFDDCVRAEERDGLRLSAAVAAADGIVRDGPPPPAQRRYLRWVKIREDLPRRIAHWDIVESFAGRCPAPKLGIAHARRDVVTWLRCWIRCLVVLPAIARIARWRRSSAQALADDEDDRTGLGFGQDLGGPKAG